MIDSILVFGDAVAEITLRIARLPEPGGDTPASDARFTLGGSAANCAVAAAEAGTGVRMIANVGNDRFSLQIIESLAALDTAFIHRIPGPSPLVIILVDPDGEKTMISARGPAGEPTPLDASAYDGIQHLHLSGYSFQTTGSAKTARQLLDHATAAGWSTSLDPSHLFASSAPEPDLLGRFTFLLPNAQEARELTGISDLERAGMALTGMGVDWVVIKDGTNGSLLISAESHTHIPAVPVAQVVDTTGAGDAYAGAFLASIVSGSGPAGAAEAGAAAAAGVIEGIGARSRS